MAAVVVAAVLAAFLAAALALEGVLLNRLTAEVALETSLRSAARVLDPADWSAGPLAAPAEAVFRQSLGADGFEPSAFHVEAAGQVDPSTGYRFGADGVAGCAGYTAPWPVAQRQVVCADVVGHVVR